MTTTVPCWEIRVCVHELDADTRDHLFSVIADLAYSLDTSSDVLAKPSERGCISCSPDPLGPDLSEFWVGPHEGALWLLHACPGSDPDYGVAITKFGADNTEPGDPVGMAAEGMDVLLAAVNNHTCKTQKEGERRCLT